MIRLVATSPPARPAKSVATASECPVPKACRRPPARKAFTMSSAAASTPAVWVAAMRSISAWISVMYRVAVMLNGSRLLGRGAVAGHRLGGDPEGDVRALVRALCHRDVEQ